MNVSLPPSRQAKTELLSLLEERRRRSHRTDPVAWIEDRLGEHLWSRQREIARAVATDRRVAVPSAHDVGKSFLAARLVAWWLDVHSPGEAFVVTTAPTASQVRAILWREINRAHRKGNLLGRTNQTEWFIEGEMVAFGRKPADYEPTAFQGIHARYVLVVLDEACHDELTEVMTEQGWCRFSDLTGSERLLTMDPDSHEAEYIQPVRLVKKPYRGPMVTYGSRGADFCVTPDHEMLYRPKLGHGASRYGEWRKASIGDLLNRHSSYQLPRTFRWTVPDQTTHTIPAFATPRKSFAAVDVPMDDWLSFLGWYCSEGSLRKGRGRLTGVTVAQKDRTVLTEIYALATRLGFRAHLYEKDVVVNSMQLAAHLAGVGDGALNKHVPEYVRCLSARQIGLFLDAYVRGDGYSRLNGREIIYTSSPRMADDLQELVLKTGVDSVIRPRALAGITNDFGTHLGTSSADGFVISRTARPTHLKFRRSNARLVDYSGFVYCATLPQHHLLLTRRHGYAIWSGNCGIPETIWQAAGSLAANEHSRILAIGNPDDPAAYFATVGSPDSGWTVISINGLDSPNFTGEWVPEGLSDLLLSRVYEEELRLDAGEESPVYKSKVLGQFPADAADGVIPLSFIRACQRQDVDWTPHQLVPIELGVDVGAGGDETVVRERRGAVAGRHWGKQTPDWSDGVALVLEAIAVTGATRVKVDVIGVGWGIVGRLKELRLQGRHKAEIIGVNVGEGSRDPTRFPKLRDQLWWEVGRGLSQSKGWDLTGVDDKTVAQLIAPKYHRDSSNRIQVEPKAETKKRLKRSPDDADALLLAYYTPAQRSFNVAVGGSRPMLEEYKKIR